MIEWDTKLKTCSEVPLSWEEVAEAARVGKLENGNSLRLTLKDMERVDLDIARDGRGRTFFIFRYALSVPRYMNPYRTNNGGWCESSMREYLNKGVIYLLPDGLRERIRPTRIVEDTPDGPNFMEDKLFLLSRVQVFGSGEDEEDRQIKLFKDPRYKVKSVFGRDVSVGWWLRSTKEDRYFDYVHQDRLGYSNYACADYEHYVVPAFCL